MTKHDTVRRQGVTRRTALRFGAALGGLALLPGSFARAQVRGDQYVFGSASLGSTGYVIIEALSTIVNRHTDLQTSSQSTSGGAENIALIGQSLLDFGQSTSVDLVPASRGSAPYPAPIEVRQLFCYTTFALPPIVKADSDIERFEDLADKRVAPGTSGGTTAQSWRLMFGAAGLADSVRFTYGSWREVYDQFSAGRVDCIPAILTNLRPAPIVRELTTNTEIRAVSFPDAVIEKAQAENPGIMRFDVTPETWPAISEPCVGTGSSGILAAHAGVDHETGYAIARAVFENTEQLYQIADVLRSVTLESATRYLVAGVPVNAGAAQYFKEQGVWRSDLTEA
ncbi:TAXI family TRAP transporter solute-binding subunit [Algihabitans albus]|uniref:TAXI family TRAP transporter solute-binding subunit n=1 Tax=Algihabitans albus TaxID=2164067 RepID=UPI000E5C9955|nr:TAXI family TRAP transporter solute-binding subunit [Algihabitans albus]